MKRNIYLLTLCLISFSNSYAKPVDYVDPFIGTGGHGHTYPGAALPHGMVQLSPDSGIEGWDHTSGYHYDDSTLYGFSHKHLSGTGVGDLNEILFVPLDHQPLESEVINKKIPYPSRFSHKDEGAQPGYYWVRLLDSDILAELTATKRVGVHRYTYQGDKGYVFIDLPFAINWNKTLDTQIQQVDDYTISGYRYSTGWAKDKRNYFMAKFNRPVTLHILNQTQSDKHKPLIRAYIDFDSHDDKTLTIKVALSNVSIKGAEKNLAKEVGHLDFDAVKEKAFSQWNKKLSVIDVEGGSKKDKTIFYTALYHSFLTPSLISDVDGHYRAANHTIALSKQPVYSTYSIWDTFRALHPLMTFTEPKRVEDFVGTLLTFYDETGTLPVWTLENNETNTMIGYHSVSVISEAYLKGLLPNTDMQHAYQAMTHSAELDSGGLGDYKAKGYIPYTHEVESVSKTLEYAYDDWVIAQVAKSLKKEADYSYYLKRSNNYQNLFDKTSGFMRPKDENGNWLSPFDPYYYKEKDRDYTEANAWQYSWFAPHDVKGLIQLMGGDELFTHHLNELFTDDTPGTGTIPPDVTGLIGQYAHGNEPSHNYAYLFAYTSQPTKTDYWVHEIMQSQYNERADGLSGNEDCGQMSAWYVLSALGFYPVNPVALDYVITTPVFDSVTLHLPDGNLNIIKADGHHRQKADFNGQALPSRIITDAMLRHGGKLTIYTNSDS